jgi:hypothetical protein
MAEKTVADVLRQRISSTGLIAPLSSPTINETVKIVPRPEPVEYVEPEPDIEIEKPTAPLDPFEILKSVNQHTQETYDSNLDRKVSKLLSRINDLENEIAEFRAVHVSRRGPAGPVGPIGPTGRQGDRGPQGESIVGPQGLRGLPGRDSNIPGPKGDQGIPGSIEEATSAAYKFIQSEILKIRNDLTGMIRQALQDCGAVDEFGNAILIPGPIGPQGLSGRDGKDSTIPGPIGATGLPGKDGKDSTIAGPPGRDGKDSTIPGPIGAAGPRGLPGRDGKDSTIAGPPGRDGRDGVDGKDSNIPGPRGAPGSIDAAVHNAEKAAIKAVLQLLKDKKSTDQN